MAIKSAQLVHTGNTTLVQRVQTAGPGNLNIPTQSVKELGNYRAVAVTHDTPDLTFSMESWDVTPAAEAMVCGVAVGGGPVLNGVSSYDLTAPQSVDIASQWLAGANASDKFLVVESVAIPQLALESIQYRFGLRATAPAAKTFSFRGDSIFYNPGVTIVESFIGSGAAGQVLTLTHPAGVYNGDAIAGPRRVQNISTGGQRLLFGTDYTETPSSGAAFTATTVTLTAAVPAGQKIRVVYFTSDAVDYPQSVHTAPSVKPAAIRGKDITVLLNGITGANRFTGIQSVQIDERFTVDRDEELGSPLAVAVDYADVPNVTGNLVVRAKDPVDFHTRLRKMLNLATATEAAGPSTFYENRLLFILHHPDTGAVLEVLEVPDAVVTLPPFSGRVNTKLDVTFSFQSDSGSLNAYDAMPTA